MRHIISVLLENESGALSRVAGLFSARGYNIHSLNVAPTLDPTLSKMTIVSIGHDDIIVQVVKQLNKLIDVVQAKDISSSNHLERELLLFKIQNDFLENDNFIKLSLLYAINLINSNNHYSTFELASDNKSISAFISEINKDNLVQITRTGISGIRVSLD